ncbi:ArsR/SmtB family transcription factor [Mycolicibacterium fluoranthenivorans]|uniref:Rhodanese-related sulfurtransferase/DNA-binding MarR family transcriptional regulator n=1 Tax=Mycolicibacterium fluoranthenivorans TaxID=258505 RepID=A0A7X5U5J5_9MYCO|nr:metalloregulator ArsR/SmtB family transcription factor [Mycolicibacterium fluoranthenivorans]MCV7354617.1 metalloregulator ArsR/SmtB family transcription factor [Mycolicibacterium fluoranthenivorans]NIH98799.1 rhodanese-related sulfurtransferase/DNA-binding MarR family transcriptional regulator [Mycolicibacterium fluoranthenivorans]
MGDRATKDALFAEFAALGKALGSPKRLEVLDLLAQGPRSVDELATATQVGISSCSAHLQALRQAGLVDTRREGTRIFYSLAGDDVAALWDHLRRVAQRHRPHTELARRAYLGPEDTTAINTDELLRRLDGGDTVILDVRPDPEYTAGHLPGAVHIPLDELTQRLSELPPGREIVAYCRGRYCVLAHDAVRLLSRHGMTARRAADGILEWKLAGLPIDTGAA